MERGDDRLSACYWANAADDKLGAAAEANRAWRAAREGEAGVAG